jgi:hypothetical protein
MTQDMTQMQIREAIVQFSDHLLKHGAGKGQVEERQRFVIRSESGRYRTAGRLMVRAGRGS